MPIYKETNKIINNLFPKFINFVESEDDEIIPHDLDGYVLTHDEIKEIIMELIKFVHNHDEKETQTYNREVYIEKPKTVREHHIDNLKELNRV